MHTDEYFEMVLSDTTYVGACMCVFHRMGGIEIPSSANFPAIDSFNSMHASIRVRVKWGYGRVKEIILMKCFHPTRS